MGWRAWLGFLVPEWDRFADAASIDAQKMNLEQDWRR